MQTYAYKHPSTKQRDFGSHFLRNETEVLPLAKNQPTVRVVYVEEKCIEDVRVLIKQITMPFFSQN